MGACEGDSTAELRAMLSHTVPFAAVRGELEVLEALEQEVTARVAELGAILSPAQVRRVWALRDAEQRLALAEQDRPDAESEAPSRPE